MSVRTGAEQASARGGWRSDIRCQVPGKRAWESASGSWNVHENTLG
jgi:hypothetical protein